MVGDPPILIDCNCSNGYMFECLYNILYFILSEDLPSSLKPLKPLPKPSGIMPAGRKRKKKEEKKERRRGGEIGLIMNEESCKIELGASFTKGQC
jgi:hypothetical protein